MRHALPIILLPLIAACSILGSDPLGSARRQLDLVVLPTLLETSDVLADAEPALADELRGVAEALQAVSAALAGAAAPQDLRQVVEQALAIVQHVGDRIEDPDMRSRYRAWSTVASLLLRELALATEAAS